MRRSERSQNPQANFRPKTTLPSLRTGETPSSRNQTQRSGLSSALAQRSIRPYTGVSGNAAIDSFLKVCRRVEWVMNPMFEKPRVETLRKVDKVDFVPNFIHNFILDREANEAATKIQRMFRATRQKRRWLALIDNKLWRRADLLRKVFYGWAAGCARDVTRMQTYYEKEFDLLSQKPWLSRKDEVASFPLFYLRGCFFAPGNLNVRNYYYMIRGLMKWNAAVVFRIWMYIARSIRIGREKRRQIRFTIKKRTLFGPVFIAFVTWHRYTTWHKQSTEKNDCVKLPCSESIINWNVREQTLNTKRARIKRACEFSELRITKKAVSALYQEYIDGRQRAQENDSSDQFWHRHVQQKGYKAWMRYISLQRHRHAVTIRVLKAWYQAFYEGVRLRNFYQIVSQRHKAIERSRMFKSWEAGARLERILSMKTSFEIQKKPAIPCMVAFFLTGRDEMAIFIMVWREWIRFTHRRRVWKHFVRRYQKIDPKKEEPLRILYGLKRAAETRIIYSMGHVEHHYLQQTNTYAIVPMVNSTREFQFALRNRSAKEWTFLTELDPSTMKFTKDILLRCFSIYVFEKMGFECYTSKRKKKRQQAPPPVNGPVWTYEELCEQFEYNCQEMKKVMRAKVQREATILTAVSSHTSAVTFRDCKDVFTVAKDDTKTFEVPTGLVYTPHLQLSTKTDDTLRVLIEQNIKNKRHVPASFRDILDNGVQAFHARYRQTIPGSEYEFENLESSRQPVMITSARAGSAAPQQTSSVIVAYRPPTKVTEVPFEEPSIKVLKQLKDTPQPLSSRQADNSFVRFQAASLARFVNANPPDSVGALTRFFQVACNVSVPATTILEPTDFAAVAEGLEQSLKHRLKRNAASFVADLCGYDTTSVVPLNVEAPPHVTTCVSVVLTIFKGLRTTKLAQYCDVIPFYKRDKLNKPELVMLRNAIFSRIQEKVPGLSADKRRSLGRHRKSSIHAMEYTETFSLTDAYTVCLLLPCIMRPDLVRDFLKDEIEIEISLNPGDESSWASTESFMTSTDAF